MIDHNQRACCELELVLLQSRNDHSLQRVLHYVRCTNLEHAGSGRVGEGKYRAEIQIMGKHGVSVPRRPFHDDPVGGAWIPY